MTQWENSDWFRVNPGTPELWAGFKKQAHVRIRRIVTPRFFSSLHYFPFLVKLNSDALHSR